jgi:predicted metal-binding membrane protein
VTGGLLLVATGVAWVVVLLPTLAMQPMAGGSAGMAGSSGMGMESSVVAELLAFLVAWGVMMAAMMLPSAIPMIALYGAVSRNGGRSGPAGLSTAAFALTYLVVWLAGGVPVFVASLFLRQAVMANSQLAGLTPLAVAVVLGAAGLYQFSPLKQACLRSCRSPLGFLMGNWRSGYRGSLALGLKHAISCVGCCLGLMVVLVAAGAMSLPWVLLIATLIFVEKVIPWGEWTARISGGLLVILGLVVLLQPDLAMLIRGTGMS